MANTRDDPGYQSAPPAPPANGGSRPVPDPTVLTTQLVDKGMASVREMLERQIAGDKGVIETRLSGMDKAVELLQTAKDRMPAEIERVVNNLKELMLEKFRGVEKSFESVRELSTQTKTDTKTAVDAAFSAAKEAVGKQNEASDRAIQKSEVSTSKEIDGLKEIINDVKDRMNRLEGADRGATAAKTTQQTSNTGNIAIIAVVMTALGLLGGLFVFLLSHKP